MWGQMLKNRVLVGFFMFVLQNIQKKKGYL